eukprot:Gb_08019 [translate_table: standard]
MARAIYFLVIVTTVCFGVIGVADNEVAVLRAIKSEWENTEPLNWNDPDPCGSHWVGVSCIGSQITSLILTSMNLRGTLANDIGYLSELQSLDLSYNQNLTGPIPNTLGKLINLMTLILVGCGFNGRIPNELGMLQNLTFLDLSSNKLIGPIPPPLGNLTKLYLLDLANNHLTGSLPVSSQNGSGLDKLVNAKHFHLNKNKLSGSIPPHIFHSGMTLIHLLLDSNRFVGEIPSTLDLVADLEIVRLDRNSLQGPIPPNIGKMKKVGELHLSNNKLSGSMPDLSEMTGLQYMDLSNNSFDPSESSEWFASLELLTTIVIENGSLGGEFPSKVLNLPQLQTVRLRNNFYNGTLKIDTSVSPQLQLIDFENNRITDVSLGESYNHTLLLQKNPACDDPDSLVSMIKPCHSERTDKSSYKANRKHCGAETCSGDWRLNSQSCECAVPYEGDLIFRSPSFSDLTDVSRMEKLTESLWMQLNLSKGAVFIYSASFDTNYYLNVHVQLFPSGMRMSFERSEILRIGYALSSKAYSPPPEFGTFYFMAYPYDFSHACAMPRSGGLSGGAIIAIAIAAFVFVLAITALGIYALMQKRRAGKASEYVKPIVSSSASWEEGGNAIKLKGARLFSFQDLKKSTNNFCEANEIGYGSYGKVYKGLLPAGGEMVAIKRAKSETLQVAVEFKNEIELLSRVHHKNLLGLIGFCFEEGEQMLVYEYMPNGTLRHSLSGRTGINLDWGRRIHIALGAAQGLSYLHENANPPIIHRDVKSSNILLDEDLNAKVADFGISKLISDGGIKGHVSTQVKGTLGYMDPEYYMTEKLSEKSDVYSFGVVLLEIITARQPIEEGKHIVREMRSRWEKGGMSAIYLQELLDPLLGGFSGLVGFESFLNLAMLCVEDSNDSRPIMSEVVKDLESIVGQYNSALVD